MKSTMKSTMKNEQKLRYLEVSDMTCRACEEKVERGLRQIKGVVKVRADRHKALVTITYIEDTVHWSEIEKRLKSLGYTPLPSEGLHPHHGPSKPPQWLSGIALILLILWLLNQLAIMGNLPELPPSASFGMIFVIGLMTSLHCVAMCGGIGLSQYLQHRSSQGTVQISTSRKAVLLPSLLYNSGRVLSYTLIGGLAGAAGQVIGLDDRAKGLITLGAGVFMILMGLSLSGAMPWIGKLIPRLPAFNLNSKDPKSDAFPRSPFLVGLLNGLMPCGPLQTMQLYALGTGSFTGGALSMLAFSLGTVPLMFGLGWISTFFSKKSTQHALTVSALLVVVLGVSMTSRGLSLAGISIIPARSASTIESLDEYGSVAILESGFQRVEIDLYPGYYEPIVVQKGIPVRFNIRASSETLNGCNDAVQIPAFGIQKPLNPGDNWIEFVPEQSGVVPYSCWMGMIRSKILVVDSLE